MVKISSPAMVDTEVKDAQQGDKPLRLVIWDMDGS
jgi:hypothetical protein